MNAMIGTLASMALVGLAVVVMTRLATRMLYRGMGRTSSVGEYNQQFGGAGYAEYSPAYEYLWGNDANMLRGGTGWGEYGPAGYVDEQGWYFDGRYSGAVNADEWWDVHAA